MSSQQPYIPLHQLQPSSTAQAAAAISAYLSGAASIVFPSQHVAQEYSSQALAGAGIAAGGAGPDGLAWRQARAIEALLLQSGQQGVVPSPSRAPVQAQGQNWPISSWNTPSLASGPFLHHQQQPIQSQQQTYNLMQQHLSLQAQFGSSVGLSPVSGGLSVHQHQPQSSYALIPVVQRQTSPILSAGSPSENNDPPYCSSSGESSTSSPLLSIASLSQRGSTVQPTIYTAGGSNASTVDPFELAPAPGDQEGMSFKDLFGFSPAVAYGNSFAAGGPPAQVYTECVSSPSFPLCDRPTSPWFLDLDDEGQPLFSPPGTDDLPSSSSPFSDDDDARSVSSWLSSVPSSPCSSPSPSDETSPSGLNIPSFSFNPLPASNAVYAPESVASFSPGTSTTSTTPAPAPTPSTAGGAPDPTNAAAAHFAYNQSLNSLNPTKRHICPICARGFARAFNLKSHLATHDQNRVKPFACEYEGCGRGFSRSHDLERHRVGIHLESPEVAAAATHSSTSAQDVKGQKAKKRSVRGV